MSGTITSRLRRRLSRERIQRVLVSRLPVIWSHHSSLIVLGVITGIGGGLSAIAFRWLIKVFTSLFFEGGAVAFSFLDGWYTVLLPALGGAIVGPLTVFFAPEARGHGVPEIMEAVAIRGGRIRPRVAVVKSIASSICIGSGGSVGREGPIAQIGAALGSMLGGLLNLPEKRIKMLVACGAAGGIAATFNAPIGGAFFALELILGEWTAEVFAPVVIAAVVAATIGRMAFGDVPAFQMPQHHVEGFAELPYFILLGLIAGPIAVLFIRSISLAESIGDRMPVPRWSLPIFGGLLVGLIGMYDHTLYGVGYEKIQSLLTEPQVLIWPLLVLIPIKLMATSITLGSGGSGGVFSPSLYIGALLGFTFGAFANAHLPGVQTEPSVYALLGMAAVFAGAAHAPVTAVLIVFELIADYHMILPLMVTVGSSVLTAKILYRFSIYNIKLVRRGVHVQLGRDVRLLNDIHVKDAMTSEPVTIHPQAKGCEAFALMENTGHHGLPLVDENGVLHGIITSDDLRRAAVDDRLDEPVTHLATHELVVTVPDETLNDALLKLGMHHVGRLPVVDPDDHRRIVGIITEKDIVDAYNRALIRQHTDLERTTCTEYFE